MAGKKILLVEGADDEHVIKNLCGEIKVGMLDEVKQLEGVSRLLYELPIELKGSDIEALGVVIDADTDLTGRWAALRDRLLKTGYLGVPERPDANGTVLTPVDKLLPRFGVWIMPDNQSVGILEDFLRFMVPNNSRLFQHVEASVAAIPAGQRRFSDLAKPKALIHTWLSWQEKPGKPPGQAIEAKYLDPRAPQVGVLIDWLKRLFFPSL